MGKLSELGLAAVAGVVLAIIYGVVFSNLYPLARVDDLALLFFIAGLATYLVVRLLFLFATRSKSR
jgi:hypothetical protein